MEVTKDDWKKKDLMPSHPVVAIDLDGTILEYTTWKGHDHFGAPFPWVKDAIEAMRAAGCSIIVNTARVTFGGDPLTTPYMSMIEHSLSEANRVFKHLKSIDIIVDTVWALPGKPIAQYYLDDRSVGYTHFSWAALLVELEIPHAPAYWAIMEYTNGDRKSNCNDGLHVGPDNC